MVRLVETKECRLLRVIYYKAFIVRVIYYKLFNTDMGLREILSILGSVIPKYLKADLNMYNTSVSVQQTSVKMHTGEQNFKKKKRKKKIIVNKAIHM